MNKSLTSGEPDERLQFRYLNLRISYEISFKLRMCLKGGIPRRNIFYVIQKNSDMTFSIQNY